MTAADGYVLAGATKLVDHGADSVRWNLVVVGDGYQAGELAKYRQDVQKFIDQMYNTPPFDELWCAINVHRVDVVSNESGADDPIDATFCPAGTGAAPHTYFDSTFCSWWGTVRLERLLTIDQTLAQTTAASRVPDVDQVLCIVNSSKYGGAGGSVATCSTHASSASIAIHEIGHSAFGLADEYENGGTASGAEPLKPNVTYDSNRATIKWGDLIDPSTPMPSACNAGCAAGCVPPATPPPPGAVGAYEGGYYVKCGAYRPLPNCYMRDYFPFCPVCVRVIRQTLAPFQPAETVTLLTPSVNFLHIPEGLGGAGVTAHRAILFEVTACRRLHFTIIAGPSGGFGTPHGLTAEARPDEYGPTGRARLWISYTSTNAGDTASGSVTVRLDETGQTWIVNLSADTVARPKTAVSLVLDRSGSMSEDAGNGTTKVAKLREAAAIFIDAMLEGDGIGLVRFDHSAQRVLDVVDVGPVGSGAGRNDAIDSINSSAFDPAGATSIGAGVVQGRDQLNDAAAAPPYDVRAMVVLTDGVENTLPMLSTVGGSINANTFAIGLGLPYSISVAALTQLTQGHQGYLVVTGALTADQESRLAKYFLQILANVTNADIVTDPSGVLQPGEEHRVPFQVTEADYGLDAFVLTPAAEALDYALETPAGDRIDAASLAGLGTTQALVRNGVAYYRTVLPAVPADLAGSHAGTWHAVLRLDPERALKVRGGDQRLRLPYSFLAHCYSNLSLRVSLVQKYSKPGDGVRLFATLLEYEAPLRGRVSVWAEVQRPDGQAFELSLQPEDGLYTAGFDTGLPGLYTVRLRAQGETLNGGFFTREQTLTAFAGEQADGTRSETPRGEVPGAAGKPLADPCRWCLFLCFLVILVVLLALLLRLFG